MLSSSLSFVLSNQAKCLLIVSDLIINFCALKQVGHIPLNGLFVRIAVLNKIMAIRVSTPVWWSRKWWVGLWPVQALLTYWPACFLTVLDWTSNLLFSEHHVSFCHTRAITVTIDTIYLIFVFYVNQSWYFVNMCFRNIYRRSDDVKYSKHNFYLYNWNHFNIIVYSWGTTTSIYVIKLGKLKWKDEKIKNDNPKYSYWSGILPCRTKQNNIDNENHSFFNSEFLTNYKIRQLKSTTVTNLSKCF